jgi:hypothetical protein
MTETKCDRCRAVIESKGGLLSPFIESLEYPKVNVSVCEKCFSSWEKLELCINCKKKLVKFLKNESEDENESSEV